MSAFEIFIEEKVFCYLLLLKISPSLKGYEFIKQGVRLLLKDPTKKNCVYKRIYREISESFNIKESLVDRAVRHSIKASTSRAGVRDFEMVTHRQFVSQYPSPREIICMLAELVRIEWIKMGASEAKYVSGWKNLV